MYASWEIISYCNLACSHCYATYQDANLGTQPKRLATEKIRLGLKNLSSVGVDQINLEGGEPTLIVDDLVELVKYSTDCGMNTIISTHGMFLLKNGLVGRLIDAGLNTISLSLDGSSADVNNAIRVQHSGSPSDQFEKVIEFIAWYTERCVAGVASVKLKINAVVRRDNLLNLREIWKLLEAIPASAPVQLKLVQVQPRGCGRLQYDKLSVTSTEFHELVDHVKANCKFPVAFRDYTGGEYPFIVVSYNGDMVIPSGENHEKVCVDGEKLNVLCQDFSEKFGRFVENRPDFMNANSKINTYRQ